MKEYLAQKLLEVISEIASVDSDIILLLVLLVMSAIVIDAVSAHARREQRAAGLDSSSTTVSIDGSKTLPLKNYVSHMQGLAGRPDAIVIENGCMIPVERKPLARKIHDRYVAQLLVYMRLVEEFEGKRPPYGYLILGPSARRFKIENSPERQAWLQKMIDEMREVLDGAPAKPAPHEKKCRKCDVKEHCCAWQESDKIVASPQGRAAQRTSVILAKRA